MISDAMLLALHLMGILLLLSVCLGVVLLIGFFICYAIDGFIKQAWQRIVLKVFFGLLSAFIFLTLLVYLGLVL